MSWGKLDDSEFQAFADKIHQSASGGELKRSVEKSLTQSGDFLVGEIKKATPVDTGGLRSAWRPSGASYGGSTFKITISNNKEYASFVENGHRQTPGRYVPAIGKRLKSKWVDGQFMMRDSVEESKGKIEKKLETDINLAVSKLFGGD